MKHFVLILTLLFCGCQNPSHNSFDSLSRAFVKWYYKNNPTQASRVNLANYHSNYKINNYKNNEQYLLDLNRFYFELTQINHNKMSKVKKREYHRLEKFMLKLLYKEESIQSRQWTPIFEIIEIEKGLRYLLNYNYLSMKNKMQNLSLRLDKINQILDNSLTNLFFISIEDYNQSIKKIELIITLLGDIDERVDSGDSNYDRVISKSKDIILRLRRYKKELLGANSDFKDFKEGYAINNDSFSIMTEVDMEINYIYNKATTNLRTEQIKLFKNCLPIYMAYEDEPIWVDYEDTLSVIRYTVNLIENEYEVNDFSYIEDSYRKNISSKFDLVKFNYYNKFSDLSYLNDDLDVIIPINLEGVVQINLPDKLPQGIRYNKISLDLLNAHNIYPGYMYLFYSNNEPFYDLNNNGRWDQDERFIDINTNEEWDGGDPITKNFPNMSMFRGAQRYAERVFLKTNKSVTKKHEILHQKNLIIDMLSCISDIDYHLNKIETKNIESLLKENSFLHNIEILNLIDKLKSNYFGYLSQKYIGYTNIMDLERAYFNSNKKNYLEFYNKTFQYGLLDYENLIFLLED